MDALGQPRKRRGKRSLATLLRDRGVLSTPHAVEVALDICDALASAHASGVVHGQLGLGCVRLAFTPEGGPRGVEIFTLTSGADESGAVQAPAAFIEPDRLGGAPQVADPRTDIWALGALLYAMLVGKSPPAGDVILPADSAARSLASVVEACLAIDRDQRPQSVDDLSERIASFATWPPDQFARLAKRRERRENAERVRQHRERHGLGNIPNVLDKLDDAALTRAQRETTAAMSSVLHTKTTEAALERLMTAVHEGTDAARIELANGLPALVDFDDEDDVVLPTTVTTEGDVSPLAPVACPITAPVVMPEVAAALAPAPAPPSATESPRARRVLVPALVALAIVLSAGFVGYALSATASATPAPAAAASAAASVHATPTPTPTAAEIPVFSPSSLPEAPPITPASLPEAKR